jgi:uncharacterized protein (DUF697 family)
MSTSAETETPVADTARSVAPVVWLLGKVQSGKTSIVRSLTQATEAEIGTGFQACTRTARVLDFPAEAPIVRFLDTRGLGEAAYDPAEDLAFCESRSHLILAVVKAMDPEQGAVLDAIRAARARHPDWPVVVAQTSLHEGYAAGGRAHVLPYPFAAEDVRPRVAEPLARALAHQRSLFGTLPGRGTPSFVPIDFTAPGDGFEPQDYGREELIGALIAAAPATVAMALAGLPDAAAAGPARGVDARILGFALAAGAGDAVPVAGVVVVPAVQAAMLHQLAKLHGTEWDRQAYAEFAAALGVGALVRTASSFGIRQLVKLIPVYGQTAGAAAAAAASFAATYAMGKAASYYLDSRRRGVEAREVASVYSKALREAFVLAKAREAGSVNKGDAR